MSSKVRLVRCPRCRKVLPELADVPIYECGGCGAVLQAKHWGNNSKDMDFCANKAVTPHKEKRNPYFDDKEDRSTSLHVTQPTDASLSGKKKEKGEHKFEEPSVSTGEFLLGKNSENLESGFRDCIEKHGRENFSDDVLNEESSPVASVNTKSEAEQMALEHSNEKSPDKYSDCYRRMIGDKQLSAKLSFHGKPGCHEHELSSGAWEKRAQDNIAYSLKPNGEIYEKELKNYNHKSIGNADKSNEAPTAKVSSNESEVASPVVEKDRDFGENCRDHFIFKSTSTESFLAARQGSSKIATQRPLTQSISAENLTLGNNKLLENFQISVGRGYNCINSTEILDSISPDNPNSVLGVVPGEMFKLPPLKSHCTYDGSVSSSDESEEHIPETHLHPFRRNFIDTDLFNVKGLNRAAEFTVNSDSLTQHQATTSSSMLLERKHCDMQDKWFHSKFMEPMQYDYSVGSEMKLKKEEHLLRMPYATGCEEGHGHDDHLISEHEVYYHSTFLDSPKMYTEPDKMELIRMIYDLQDQLNQVIISNRKSSGRLPSRYVEKEIQTQLYNNHWRNEGEIYNDLRYSTHAKECSREQHWSQPCKISNRVLSRYQVDPSYLDYHSTGRNWSMQLPCCAFPHNEDHGIAYPSPNVNSSCYSNTCSLHHTSSELFSRTCETNYEGHEMKRKDLRGKKHTGKRHIQAKAGGAPLLACYYCSELLQMPVDFLCFKRKHWIRCGACSKVLKFSLQKKVYEVPFVSNAATSLPGDNYADNTNNNNTRYSGAVSTTYGCAHDDTLSCFDDYEESFGRSLSAERDPLPLVPRFHNHGRNFNERQKSVLADSENNEVYESAGPSSLISKQAKPSSEIEELGQAPASPLHQLMGYSSLSQVMNR